MSIELAIYLVSLLGNIGVSSIVIFVLSLVSTIILTVGYFISSCDREFDEDTGKLVKKLFKISLSIFIVSLIICVAIPSQKEMYVILGIHTIKKAYTESPNIPDKAIKLLEKKLDELLEKDKD